MSFSSSRWTEDPETRYYFGLASYEKMIRVSEDMLQPGIYLKLDFGLGRPLAEQRSEHGIQAWLDAPVREAAEVYINGLLPDLSGVLPIRWT